MAKTRSPNNFLASLSPSDFRRVQPHLKSVELKHEAVLFETNAKIRTIYFPHSGIISLVVPLAGGQTIEAAMIGRDSIVGASPALDSKISLNKGIVQAPGVASMMPIAAFRNVAGQSNTFRSALVRHEQFLFAQAQQAAACNASHKVEARMARWLLRARDLSGEDTIPLTQEFFSQMLGVQRTFVSDVANSLQKLGFINFSRGRVQVTNHRGLCHEACECYAIIKRHYDRLLKGLR